MLKEPLAVSAKEVEQFAAVHPNNARPVQPLQRAAGSGNQVALLSCKVVSAPAGTAVAALLFAGRPREGQPRTRRLIHINVRHDERGDHPVSRIRVAKV